MPSPQQTVPPVPLSAETQCGNAMRKRSLPPGSLVWRGKFEGLASLLQSVTQPTANRDLHSSGTLNLGLRARDNSVDQLLSSSPPLPPVSSSNHSDISVPALSPVRLLRHVRLAPARGQQSLLCFPLDPPTKLFSRRPRNAWASSVPGC